MRSDVSRILAAVCGYAAAVIGAGFASGQEIISFFVVFGKSGAAGIVIACLSFALFSYLIFRYCTENEVYSYSEALRRLFPQKLLYICAEIVIFFGGLVSVCIMTACAGGVGEVFGLPPFAGAAVFAALCAGILLMNVRRVMELNSLLGIALITGIIFVCFYILRYREHQTVSRAAQAAASGVSYAGYNIIGTGAVLAEMSRYLRDKRDAALASAASGTVLFVMIMLLWGVLSIYYGKINLGEIPMLTMSLRQNRILGIIYGIMLTGAALSTGICNGFTLIDMSGRYMRPAKTIFFLALVSLAASGAGFTSLINTVYRFCGYFGAVVAVIVMLKIAIKLKNKEK